MVQKCLGYFSILRLLVLTMAMVYFLFFFSTIGDPMLRWVVLIQLYIVFSFAGTITMMNGLDCVSLWFDIKYKSHYLIFVQTSCKKMFWFIADNGFCVIFYSVQAMIVSMRLSMSNESGDVKHLSTLICHCLIMIIHSFVLVCAISTYAVVKSYIPTIKPSTFHVDYYSNIERSRVNLNEGYEVPVALNNVYSQCKLRQDCQGTSNPVAFQSDHHEAGSRMSSFKKTTDADVHQVPKSMVLYDEIANIQHESQDEAESWY